MIATSHGGTRGVVTVDGDKEIIRLLDGFPDKLTRRFLRTGMRKSGQAATSEAKGGAPKVTRTLNRSIGYRVYTSRGTVGVVIGPRKGYGRWVVRETIGKRRKRLRFRAVGRKEDWGKLKVRRRWADPVKYGHLVEGGFKHKRSGKTVAGRPYMAPALHPGAALANVRSGVQEAIAKVRT